MFLQEILKDDDYLLLLDKYTNEYLDTIEYENFMKVYKYLKSKRVYFIEDLILNYLDIFTLDVKIIEEAFDALNLQYGDDYIYTIGDNLKILDDAIIEVLER